jgi:hypothetical protein
MRRRASLGGGARRRPDGQNAPPSIARPTSHHRRPRRASRVNGGPAWLVALNRYVHLRPMQENSSNGDWLPQFSALFRELIQIICEQLAPVQPYCAVRGSRHRRGDFPGGIARRHDGRMRRQASLGARVTTAGCVAVAHNGLGSVRAAQSLCSPAFVGELERWGLATTIQRSLRGANTNHLRAISSRSLHPC